MSLVFKKTKVKPSLSNKLYNLGLTAVFLSLVIACKLITHFFNFIEGYSLQLQYLPLILGMIFIPLIRYKFLLYLLSPVILLIFGFSGNPIFDYLFTGWSWWIFLFLGKPILKTTYFKAILIITFCMVVSFLQMWWWNSLSGVLFYEATWDYSFKFNIIFNGINFGILIVLVLWISYYVFNFKITLVDYKAQLLWKHQKLLDKEKLYVH